MITRSLFVTLAILFASPALAQTSGCGVLCPEVSAEVARWMYQNDPERVREQRERDQSAKRTRVFICEEQTYRERAFVCTERVR